MISEKYIDFKEWLRFYIPESFKSLLPPVSVTKIMEFESEFNIIIPDGLKSIYMINNGQGPPRDGPGIIYNIYFLSIENVAKERRFLNDSISYKEGDSFQPGKIKTYNQLPKWIPFASDYSGNYIAIDYDPDEKGSSGQIINFGTEEQTKYILGENFDEFIGWYFKQIENGSYIIENGPYYKKFRSNKFHSEHFLDAVRKNSGIWV